MLIPAHWRQAPACPVWTYGMRQQSVPDPRFLEARFLNVLCLTKPNPKHPYR
jgi:hypothetical protein